jgi:hypothetical protein
MIEQFDDMRFLLINMFDGNKARMLRIVTDGLVKAKKENNLVLVGKIERDIKLIKELK